MLVIAVNELYTPKSHTVSLGHLWLHVNPYVTISGPAGLAYSIQPTRQGGKESWGTCKYRYYRGAGRGPDTVSQSRSGGAEPDRWN